jgi:phage antirepressor YoqD-like protein
MAKFQVTIKREVTEVTTLELDVKKKDVIAFMRQNNLIYREDWRVYVDQYVEHQVDLTDAALQSNVDIETQSETEWEVLEAIE